MSLALNQVWKSYNKATILSDISLSIEAGDCVLLCGPSGAGKSTLSRILALVEEPDCGDVSVDGLKLKFLPGNRPPTPPRWTGVALLFQQAFLWPNLSGLQNILLASKRASISQELWLLVTRLGIDGLLNRYPEEMSVGERMRVGLVRCLAAKPKYLILDEPTAAVDIPTAQLIVETIANVAKQGIGVLVVSHNLDIFFRLSKISYFLADGVLTQMAVQGKLLQNLSERATRFAELCGVSGDQC